MRHSAFAILFVAASALLAGAQNRKPAAGQPEVVEATHQKVKIRANNSEFSQYRFVLVWKDATPPATGFFYKEGKEWKETTVARPERRAFGGGSQDYMMVENTVEPKNIKTGDRLIITTHRHDHGDEEMPAAVKKLSTNGLFYGTGNSKSPVWKQVSLTVRNLPDRLQ